jgi:hypothetical protein
VDERHAPVLLGEAPDHTGRPVGGVVHEDDPELHAREPLAQPADQTCHVVRLVARRDDYGKKHPAGAPLPAPPVAVRPCASIAALG